MNQVKPLHEAVLKSDINNIVSVTSTTPELDPQLVRGVLYYYEKMKRDPRGARVTPLLAAIHFDEFELCKYLISEDADINMGKLRGLGPLALALELKNYSLAKLLIASGADVNLLDDEGRTPMYHAIKRGSPASIVEDLLSAGAHKDGETHFRDTRQKIKRTPLACAMYVENIPVMKCLLEHSVDVEAFLDVNTTPLHYTVARGSYEMSKLLVDAGANVEGNNRSQVHVFYLALRHGNWDIIKLLVENAPDIDEIINKRFIYDHGKLSLFTNGTRLHMAVSFCNFQAVKLLIEHGASVNIGDPEFQVRPIDTFISIVPNDLTQNKKKNYKNILGLLIENGVDVFASTEIVDAPLHDLVKFERWVAIEECIRCGIDLNRVVHQKNNLTLLHYLVPLGLKNLVALCLEFGADSTKLMVKSSSFDITVWKQNDPYLIKLFLKHSTYSLKRNHIRSICNRSSTEVRMIFDNEFKLKQSIHKNDAEGVRKALKNGALPSGSGAGSQYPLHEASLLGYPEVVEVLLRYGSPPNVLDLTRKFPIHLAALNGDPKICKSLLQHGAVFDYLSPRGLSSLEIAENAPVKGRHHKKVVEVLNSVGNCFKMLKTRSRRVVKQLEKKVGSEDFWCVVNCHNKKGRTLMGEALWLGQLEIAIEIMYLKFQATEDQSDQV